MGVRRGQVTTVPSRRGAAMVAFGIGARSVPDPQRSISPAACLINVTPIGIAGGPEAKTLAFAPAVIDAAKVVLDVVALPPETPLIRYAKSRSKPVITGAEVIALQAAEQFALYTGVRPTEEQIRCASEYARG